LRNSKTLTLFRLVSNDNPNAQLYDPNVEQSAIKTISDSQVITRTWRVVVVGVAHSNYSQEVLDHLFGEDSGTKLIVDIPGMLGDHDRESSTQRYWRL